MKLSMQYCTLTGADEAVDPTALAQIAKTYPYVEWGILCSGAPVAVQSFPSTTWIERFKLVCDDCNKSIHLCGNTVEAFIRGDSNILRLVRGFDRVQLNFRQAALEPVSLLRLRARIAAYPTQIFITQHNTGNASLLESLAGIKNHALLIDYGNRVPEHWPDPVPGIVCGYAGGLGQDNLLMELINIGAITDGSAQWVDMDNMLRDAKNNFNLAIAEAILKGAKPFCIQPRYSRNRQRAVMYQRAVM